MWKQQAQQGWHLKEMSVVSSIMENPIIYFFFPPKGKYQVVKCSFVTVVMVKIRELNQFFNSLWILFWLFFYENLILLTTTIFSFSVLFKSYPSFPAKDLPFSTLHFITKQLNNEEFVISNRAPFYYPVRLPISTWIFYNSIYSEINRYSLVHPVHHGRRHHRFTSRLPICGLDFNKSANVPSFYNSTPTVWCLTSYHEPF